MNNIHTQVENGKVIITIDLTKEAKPGKTKDVLIHAQNQKFITVGKLQGREIGLGNLFITSRPISAEVKSAPAPAKVSKPIAKTSSAPATNPFAF
jgi:hypothetical protein